MGRRESPDQGWRPQLTAHERRQGWVFLALYLFVFPLLKGWMERLMVRDELEAGADPMVSNTVYYLCILAVLIAAFWEFLRNAVTILRGDPRRSGFAFLAGALLGALGTVLVSLIPLPVENPAHTYYPQMFALSPGLTVAVAVILRPAAEELLYRGFLFGALRKKHRGLAYCLSAGLFALAAVWQFTFPGGGPLYLLLFLRYLPLGLAMTWCYDVAGSVLTPIAARMAVSAVFLVLAL